MLHFHHRQARPQRAGPLFRRKDAVILLAVPALASVLLFSILPGAVCLPAAFRSWMPPQPLSAAEYVGLRWFRELLHYHGMPELIRNSVVLGLWDIALLPVPLAVALASQYCALPWLKKALDVFSLIPVFIPSVIVAAVTQKILCTEGLLNQFLALFGAAPQNYLLDGRLFCVYFSLSGLWSGMGFPCLVYKACLSAASRDLHAAAQMDGAGLLTRILHIDLPVCRATFLINLTLQAANILCTSTERLLLFRNTANSSFSTKLDLYAYELTFRASLMPAYSKAIALGLVTSAVNLTLLCLARRAAAQWEYLYD